MKIISFFAVFVLLLVVNSTTLKAGHVEEERFFFADPFSVKTTLTGLTAGDLAWGDYDNDGDLDVAVTGSSNSGSSGRSTVLYTNDGSGTFTMNASASSTFVNAYNSSLAWGDYNNDGYLDLVVSGSTTSSTTRVIELYTNDKDGTFTKNTSASSTFTAFTRGSMAWGDYNNDGFLDLITIGSTSSGAKTFLYTNDGDGTFTNSAASSTFTGASIADVEWADYDNDGDLDVSLSGEVSSGNSIADLYTNNGNGTFTKNTSASTTFTGVAWSAMAWGDYNSDGHIDVVFTGSTDGTSSNSTTDLYTNDGDGTFTRNATASSVLLNLNQGDVVWGDYDHDGHLDLVVTGINTSGTAAKLYNNNGSGSFTEVTFGDITFEDVVGGAVAWGDYNRDNDLDLIVQGGGSSGVSITIYNSLSGGGAVPSVPSNATSSINGNTITLAWNASTDSDGGPISYNVYLRHADSTNTFIAAMSDVSDGTRRIPTEGNAQYNTSINLINSNWPDGAYSWGVQAIDGTQRFSDFNDQFILKSGSSLELLSGFFSKETPISASLNDVQDASAAWGDYDNDGDLDVVILGTTDGTATGRSTKLYTNNGSSFSEDVTASTLFTNVYQGSLAWADYDNDDDIDLIVSGATDGAGESTNLYINNGDGTFSVSSASFADVGKSALAWGDYNNDGFVDVVISGTTDNANTGSSTNLYKNNGDGTFTSIVTTLTNVSSGSLAWADHDKDDDLDLVISGETTTGATTKLYTNNAGVLSENATASAVLTDVYLSSLGWADINNDGDLDLVVSGTTDGTSLGRSTRLYNNTNGAFSLNSTASTALTNVYQGSAFWVDYDGDGDMDLTLSGSIAASDTTLLFNNNGSGIFTKSASLFSTTLPNVSKSSLTWADYDSDGDIDLLVIGKTGASQASSLFKRFAGADGTAPSRPSSITATVVADTVTFGWPIGSDSDGGPRTYNLYVKNQDSTQYTVSASKGTSGFRRLSGYGNTGLKRSFKLTRNLSEGTYNVGVQTVDGSLKSSTFRTSTFVVDRTAPAAPTGLAAVAGVESVALNWSSNPESDISFYRIYRETDSTATPTNVVSTSGGTTRTLGGLEADSTYYFYISAVDQSNNESPVSTRASAVPISTTWSIRNSISGVIRDLEKSSLAWGDYNNDGFLDLAISGSTGSGRSAKLYTNNGANSFSENAAASITIKGQRDGELAWGDYDNDGDLDLAATGEASNANRNTALYTNNGDGTFVLASASLTFTEVEEGSLAWGDYDNDGDLDLVVGGTTDTDGIPTGGLTNLYINNGDSTFTNSAASSTFTGISEGDVAWADYDNDGDLDLVITGAIASGGGTTELYTNNGNGTFTQNVSASTTFRNMFMSSLAWADYDNDGDVDLLLMGSTNAVKSGAHTELYTNNGDGTFTLATASSTFTDLFNGSLAWGDFDNDGDLDIAISGQDVSTGITQVYNNNGNGTFTESEKSSNLTDLYHGDIALADYNNDGALDLAISGLISSGSRTSNLFKNTVDNKGNAPSTPSDLVSTVSGDTLSLSWDASTDTDGGPLSYNIFLTNIDSSTTYIPAMSNIATGFRRISQRGNNGSKTTFSMDISSYPDGLYGWGVQAIDGSHKHSTFAKKHFVHGGDGAALSGTAGWRLLTSPAVGSKFSTILNSFWTQGFTGAGSTGGSSNVYVWSTADGTDNASNWTAPSSLETSLPVGQGALVYIFSDDNGPNVAGDSGFPKRVPISGSAPTGDLNLSSLLNSNVNGRALLGNPFRKDIDWDLLTKNDISNTVYIWDHNASGWRSWNGTAGTLDSGVIPSFNAFFVQTTGASPSLTIPQSAKLGSRREALGKVAATQQESKVLRLKARSGSLSADAWVSFQEGGEVGRDNYDGLALTPYSPSYLQLATAIEDGNVFQINALPINQAEELSFPLELFGKHDSNTATLSFEGLEDFEDWALSILDTSTDETFPIEEGATMELEIEKKLAKANPQDLLAVPVQRKAKGASSRYRLILTPPVSVSTEDVEANLPTEVELSQNYPNPFNPTTTINFALPQASNVRLQVFDLLGREVAMLVNGQQASGRHSITFDARRLSSGVYIYRLQVAGAVLTRKLTLIK